MPLLADPLVLRPAQHLDDVANTESLADTIDAGERLARILAAIIGARRIQADIAVAAGLALILTKVVEQDLAAAGLRLGKGRHQIQLVLFNPLLLRVAVFTTLQHAAQPLGVRGVKQQQGLGRQTISTGAAGLLVVGLDILGRVVMDHETHVGFVDAHAERHGRHHHLDVIAQEGLLHAGSFVTRQARVIAGGPNTAAAQEASDLFGAIATGAIDDAALPLLLIQIGSQLLIRLVLIEQTVADIRSIEAGQMLQGIL